MRTNNRTDEVQDIMIPADIVEDTERRKPTVRNTGANRRSESRGFNTVDYDVSVNSMGVIETFGRD